METNEIIDKLAEIFNHCEHNEDEIGGALVESLIKQLSKADVSDNEVVVCSFENKCYLYQESNCNQKTCGDFHKQTDR